MAKKKRLKPAPEHDPLEVEFDWTYSPAELEFGATREVVWLLLEGADVDAKRRQIIWPDGKKLTIAQSVQRIHTAHPDLSADVIEAKVISWLELAFSPDDRPQKEVDELDRLLDEWLAEYG
jgi:hypothetical protein